jgi:hypothetical protein
MLPRVFRPLVLAAVVAAGCDSTALSLDALPSVAAFEPEYWQALGADQQVTVRVQGVNHDEPTGDERTFSVLSADFGSGLHMTEYTFQSPFTVDLKIEREECPPPAEGTREVHLKIANKFGVFSVHGSFLFIAPPGGDAGCPVGAGRDAALPDAAPADAAPGDAG